MFFRAIAYEGLYTLESHPKAEHAKTMQNTQNMQNGPQNDTSPANDTSPTYNKGESEDWKILHRRLSHVSYKRIKQLLEGNFVSLIKLKDKRRLSHSKKLCEPCLTGKIKESFNKKTNKCEGKRVRRLYADLSRYYLVFIQGFRYFLVVLCDASRIV
jgi:hypothetical protein